MWRNFIIPQKSHVLSFQIFIQFSTARGKKNACDWVDETKFGGKGVSGPAVIYGGDSWHHLGLLSSPIW